MDADAIIINAANADIAPEAKPDDDKAVAESDLIRTYYSEIAKDARSLKVIGASMAVEAIQWIDETWRKAGPIADWGEDLRREALQRLEAGCHLVQDVCMKHLDEDTAAKMHRDGSLLAESAHKRAFIERWANVDGFVKAVDKYEKGRWSRITRLDIDSWDAYVNTHLERSGRNSRRGNRGFEEAKKAFSLLLGSYARRTMADRVRTGIYRKAVQEISAILAAAADAAPAQ